MKTCSISGKDFLEYLANRKMPDDIAADVKEEKKANKHLEHDLQKECIRWFRMQYPKLVLFSIPNGSYCGIRQARILISEGLLKGVPDLFLAYPNDKYNGLFIEMKAGKKGVVREEQKMLMERLEECKYKCQVCRSFEEFKECVDTYLSDIG